MPDLHLSVLPKAQQKLWALLQRDAAFLKEHGYYLAGGTALAMQLGHRGSQDFDFFSQKKQLGEPTRQWLEGFPHVVIRDFNEDTIHGEITLVKISFIGAYKYPTTSPLKNAQAIPMAGILDIGLMKLLAVTHRATIRDYLDIAAILRHGVPLKELLDATKTKYGSQIDPMLFLRALSTFSDVDEEYPEGLDSTLKKSWKSILLQAIKKTA